MGPLLRQKLKLLSTKTQPIWDLPEAMIENSQSNILKECIPLDVMKATYEKFH